MGIGLLTVSGFVLAGAIRRRPDERRAARAVLITAIVLAVAFVANAVIPPGYGGLAERLIAVTGAIMIVFTAVPTIRARPPASRR